MESLLRETVYIKYYFIVQFEQIWVYWILGMAIGSFISVFCKERIHQYLFVLDQNLPVIPGILIFSILGIFSPLCMYGTIPLAASLYHQGCREEWLGAFMVSSILLNPQLIIYSMALGVTLMWARVLSCLACGMLAGLILWIFHSKQTSFFNFSNWIETKIDKKQESFLWTYIKDFGRNMKKTGIYFLLGIFLSALFQRYISADLLTSLLRDETFGIFLSATIGVPLYMCGGGTIPLLQGWLSQGMSVGNAVAFMVSGPATKITNLGALKMVLGNKHFCGYILFVWSYALLCGFIWNGII